MHQNIHIQVLLEEVFGFFLISACDVVGRPCKVPENGVESGEVVHKAGGYLGDAVFAVAARRVRAIIEANCGQQARQTGRSTAQ